MAAEKSTVLITGGTKGIGFSTARKLAKLGHRVVLTGRSQSEAERAALSISSEVAGAEVVGMSLDLSALASVRAFTDAFKSKGWPLNILINNAGIWARNKQVELTSDGIETTLQSNVIGPFLLTQLLLDLLISSAPTRVINVSSRLHLPKSGYGGEVNWDWDNLKGEKSFDPVIAYKNSKLAVMWFTYELNRRLAGKGVVAVAVCPGFVPETAAEHLTGLERFIFKHILPLLPSSRSLDQASDNCIFAATDPAYSSKGGVLIGEKHEVPSSQESYEESKAKRFWQLADQLVKGELR